METKQTALQQEIPTPTPPIPALMDETTLERIELHRHPEAMSFEELCDIDSL